MFEMNEENQQKFDEIIERKSHFDKKIIFMKVQ